METITHNISTIILFRVGSSKKLKLEYNENRISFSCAANWIDYSYKKGNDTIGDMLDSMIGYLPANDTRPDKYGNNVFKLINPKNEQYVFLQPAILMPMLSFYSVREETVIDLKRYTEYIKYDPNNSSILVIEKPLMFFDELKKQIPRAIEKNIDKLTHDDFVAEYDKNNPVFLGNVSYDKYDGSYFYDPENWLERVFMKRKIYKYQSEMRCVIQNIAFKQKLPYNGDEYKTNTLSVDLPNLKSYAKVFDIPKLDIFKVDKNAGYLRFIIKNRKFIWL